MTDMGMGGAVDTQDAQKNKVMALLSYFGIFLAIPFFMARQSPFVKFHLNQGIIFLCLAIVGSVGTTILGVVFGMLGSIGTILSSVTSLVYGLVMLAFFVIGAMNAWGGKQKQLPVIGGLFTALK